MHLGGDERRTLEFKAKAPISIFLDDERADYKPGCSVLEISFAEPVTIEEIKFRNNYTAYISLTLKKVPAEKDVKNRDILPWQTSLKRYILMPEPESEACSQDSFSIHSKESSVPWNGIVNLRIVLKQPTFRWKKFGIEELTMFGEPTKDLKSATCHSASSRRFDCRAIIHEEEKVAPIISSMGKYIWTVAELMRDKQTTGTAVGRFEVDGSYDIGHLI